MKGSSSLEDLVTTLRLAYSGELAAARAYRGHSNSVRDEIERDGIRKIENEEWRHRELVGRMLATLGRKPSFAREMRARVIGRILGAVCHVVGWFVPMYGAGRLESRNILEYETAARHAAQAGHPEFVDCLLTMAELEWEHEAFFRARVCGHRWARWVAVWPMPAPKDEIRASFEKEFPSADQAVDRQVRSTVSRVISPA